LDRSKVSAVEEVFCEAILFQPRFLFGGNFIE